MRIIKIKKILLIILSNILIILSSLCILEYILYQNYHKHHPEIFYKIIEIKYNNNLFENFIRKPIGTEYEKRPIIIGGCSFAWGQGLKQEQSFGYKLAHLSKRPVYNFSLFGKGLQHNLFYIQHLEDNKEIKNPEYYIYVFINDQIRRLYSPVCFHDNTGFPQYDIDKNENLKLKKNIYPFYKQFYVYYFFNNLYFHYLGYKDYKKHSILTRAYIKEIKREITKRYPEIKFILLFYGDYERYFNLDLEELKKEGIDFVHTQDLSDENIYARKYHIGENDFHPSEEAWDLLTPALVEKLKL